MAEVGVCVLAHIFLQPNPIAVVRFDLLAVNANRQKSVQRFDLVQSALQRVFGLLQGTHRALALSFERSHENGKGAEGQCPYQRNQIEVEMIRPLVEEPIEHHCGQEGTGYAGTGSFVPRTQHHSRNEKQSQVVFCNLSEGKGEQRGNAHRDNYKRYGTEPAIHHKNLPRREYVIP